MTGIARRSRPAIGSERSTRVTSQDVAAAARHTDGGRAGQRAARTGLGWPAGPSRTTAVLGRASALGWPTRAGQASGVSRETGAAPAGTASQSSAVSDVSVAGGLPAKPWPGAPDAATAAPASSAPGPGPADTPSQSPALPTPEDPAPTSSETTTAFPTTSGPAPAPPPPSATVQWGGAPDGPAADASAVVGGRAADRADHGLGAQSPSGSASALPAAAAVPPTAAAA